MSDYKYLAALCALAVSGSAVAAQTVEADEVVVTASRVPSASRSLPAPVTVIDRAAIERSPATNVPALLAQQAGVHVFSMDGSDNGVIDLRGFGVTASSNTLILVDGVRQNTDDLAAPALAMIPLDSIERIEVVRGSGSVVYGGGAVGGVVNIITRNAFDRSENGRVTVMTGSHGKRGVEANAVLRKDDVALDGFVQSKKDPHFRVNNEERQDGGGLALSIWSPEGSARLYARSNSESLRWAGSRLVDFTTGQDQMSTDPAGTSTPRDFGTLKTDTIGAQLQRDLGPGRLFLDASHRDKRTTGHYDGFSDDNRALHEDLASTRYEWSLAGGHRIVTGLDYLGSDARMDHGGAVAYRTVQQTRQALFAEAGLQLAARTRLTTGARIERAETDIAKPAKPALSQNETRHAWSLGVRQQWAEGLSGFARLAQSYRFANSDEQNAVLPGAGPLQTQVSHDQQLGIEWVQTGTRARLTVFNYDLNNEIIYLSRPYPLPSANVNLDPTRRRGVEFEGGLPVARDWRLDGNLTWQEATFRGNDLSGRRVPMTPRVLANLALSWQATEATRLAASVNHVGAQRLDSDTDNTFTRDLPAYTLLGLKATHRFGKQFDGSFGISNLLDKHYASYGGTYGAGSTTSYLYPADGRAWTASLTMTF